MFPPGGEHGDRGVLLSRSRAAAAAPGALSVDEGAAAAQPLPAGEAQVSVNYVTHSAPRLVTYPGVWAANPSAQPQFVC